jgi:hypothetical protein
MGQVFLSVYVIRMWGIDVERITFKTKSLFIEAQTGIITTAQFSWQAILNILLDIPIMVEDGVEITLRHALIMLLSLFPTLKPTSCTPCRPRTRPTGCGSGLPVEMHGVSLAQFNRLVM